MSRLSLASSLPLFLALGTPAQAWQPPAALGGTPTLEAADGQALRQNRHVTWEAGRGSAPWRRFLLEEGGTWRSLWDTTTRVPLRIFGSGLPAPGAVSYADLAELHALMALEAHLSLLAPGARPEDFVLVSNDLTRGLRTVGFRQTHQGLPVLGGQVSFRFRRDRLVVLASEALPWVSVTTGRWIDAGRAARAAQTYLRTAHPVPSRLRGVSGPVVLPLVPERTSRAGLRYVVVWVVDLQADSLPGRWDVYVDALTGHPVARRQTLRFATGVIRFNVPQRWPGAVREDAPAAWADVTADGTAMTCDVDGGLTFGGAGPASVSVAARGPYAEILNAAGGAASTTLSLVTAARSPGTSARASTMTPSSRPSCTRTEPRPSSGPWGSTWPGYRSACR